MADPTALEQIAHMRSTINTLESQFAGVTIPQWEAAPDQLDQLLKEVTDLGRELFLMSKSLWARRAAIGTTT